MVVYSLHLLPSLLKDGGGDWGIEWTLRICYVWTVEKFYYIAHFFGLLDNLDDVEVVTFSTKSSIATIVTAKTTDHYLKWKMIMNIFRSIFNWTNIGNTTIPELDEVACFKGAKVDHFTIPHPVQTSISAPWLVSFMPQLWEWGLFQSLKNILSFSTTGQFGACPPCSYSRSHL